MAAFAFQLVMVTISAIVVVFLIFAPDVQGLRSRIGRRIVNGTNATKIEFPFLVSIRDSNDTHFCGGTIWAPQWIITAASCIEDGWSGVQVVAGAYDLANPDPSQEQRVNVTKGYYHPTQKRDSEGVQTDIALLRLNSPLLTNGASVGTIATPIPGVDDDPPAQGVVAGWGSLAAGEDPSPPYPTVLQKTTVDHVDDQECVDIYAGVDVAINPSSQVCYLTPYTGTCQGDTGGPLVGYINNDSSLPYQEGVITSAGINCASPNFPGVYVRLTAITQWINVTIADNNLA